MRKTKETKILNKGITLIALIITIIVMLILVAVTINMAINGGLFNYAGKAVADMQNAINAEQQLANGRIKIAGVWYDSINDYIKNIPSKVQDKQGIIIIPKSTTKDGNKMIQLKFCLDGMPVIDEYWMVYANKGLLDFINSNFYTGKTPEQIEAEAISKLDDEEKSEMTTNGVFKEEARQQIISGMTQLLKQETGMEVSLPYEQSLRIYVYLLDNGALSSQEVLGTLADRILQMAAMDMVYNYVCEIIGVKAAYGETAIEEQLVSLMKYNGTFEQMISSMGISKTELQDEAKETKVTYEMLLKISALSNEEFEYLVTIDVATSDGRTFAANFFDPLEIPVTTDGNFTITATMKDGSGRKGEKTIVIKDGEIVDGDTEEKNWALAWTYSTAKGWEGPVEFSEEATLQGEIFAKFYPTGGTIKPTKHPSIGDENTLSEGPEYKVVIEGSGDMGSMYDGSNLYGYYRNTLSGVFSGTVDDLAKIYPSYVTEVEIKDGITSIGGFAFKDFTSLTSISIPDSVTKIDESAFSCCSALTNITIPSTVIRIGTDAFNSCLALTSISIPTGVTVIEEGSFAACSNLTNITMPQTITSIGKRAFQKCLALTTITLPSELKIIGEEAFNICSALNNITIPSKVTSIGNSAFSSCAVLTSITIPNSVEELGERAFYNCSALENIVISSNKITNIKLATFQGCSSLTSIIIPEGVTTIGNQAFYGCSKLASVTLPSSLTNIEDSGVFYGSSEDLVIYVPNDTVETLVKNKLLSETYKSIQRY